MFYALALVCDHYFVPSLDVIIGRLSAINNEKRIEDRYYRTSLYLLLWWLGYVDSLVYLHTT